jgi:hypothetical protein
MEEKVSNLDEENRMLRQAVASHPTLNSVSSENHEESNHPQVPAISLSQSELSCPELTNHSCASVC